MADVESHRYAVSSANYCSRNEDLIKKLSSAHADISLKAMMVPQRDEALSFLKKVLKVSKKRNNVNYERVLTNVQLFRIFLSYRDTDLKSTFIKGEVATVVHDILIMFKEISKELEKRMPKRVEMVGPNLSNDSGANMANMNAGLLNTGQLNTGLLNGGKHMGEHSNGARGAENFCFKWSSDSSAIKNVETVATDGSVSTMATNADFVAVQMVDQILIECCWFFTNLFIAEESEVMILFNKGVDETIIDVLKMSPNTSVKMHCLWSLRNACASSLAARDKLMKQNILHVALVQMLLHVSCKVPLIDITCPDYSSGLQTSFENTILKMFEQIVELTRNIVSYKTGITYETAVLLKPMFKYFTTSCKNTTLLKHTFMIMSIILESISSGRKSKPLTKAIDPRNFVDDIFEEVLLSNKNDSFQKESNQKVSNQKEFNTNAKDERQDSMESRQKEKDLKEKDPKKKEMQKCIDLFLEENLLGIAHIMMLHKKDDLAEASLRLVGDALLGSSAQITRMIDLGVLRTLIELSKSSRLEIRKEVCWCLSNCATTFSKNLKKFLDCHVILDETTLRESFNMKPSLKVTKMNAMMWLTHLFAQDPKLPVRFELAWFFNNMIQTAGKEALDLAVQHNVHVLICRFLQAVVPISFNASQLIFELCDVLGNVSKDYPIKHIDAVDIYVTLCYTLSEVLLWDTGAKHDISFISTALKKASHVMANANKI
jgi:hypothetical protein